MKFLLLAIATLSLLTVEAEASRRDKRQHLQRERIQQGVKSGELTRGEAHRLRRQQRHINRVERRAEADGVVTAREEAKIERKQDRASKNIGFKKHNAKERAIQ